MGWREIIVSLNSLSVGDLDAIRQKIDSVQKELGASGQAGLARYLADASEALVRGDLPEYRRLLSLVVSRLGHLRD